MAEKKKAVLFNFWGLLVPSRPWEVFQDLEQLRTLPRGFLESVASQDGGAVRRAERGAITVSQMIPAFQAECEKAAQDQAVTLPPDWSVQVLLEKMDTCLLDVRSDVLKAAARLRSNGILTAVLTNHWVDDRPEGAAVTAQLLCLLGARFDLVLQSCRSGHRVPQADMFRAAVQRLGVTAQQAVWLDSDPVGVKAAQDSGMEAVLVEDLNEAFSKLVDFTGVQALKAEGSLWSCSSDQVSHGYVSIRPGVNTHFVEKGCGPPVLLCHGFPESWFSWRYQIPALAAAGFRVLALDMKGYGESTAPPDIEEYSQEQICKDLIIFLDKMAIPQVTVVGHDWGGATVWTLAHCYPERVRAVASLNTPRFPSDPSVSPDQRFADNPVFDYQVYLQTPGVAEAELEKDLERTFKIFFFRGSEAGKRPPISTSGVCARGGLLVGLPQEVPRSSMLTEEELQYYVSRYREQGFRRPLNWYRNHVANWRWTCSRPCEKLLMPALMVTVGKDPVLHPSLAQDMGKQIPNLTSEHIEDSGHWTQVDKPAETNHILISWLKKVHRRA